MHILGKVKNLQQVFVTILKMLNAQCLKTYKLPQFCFAKTVFVLACKCTSGICSSKLTMSLITKQLKFPTFICENSNIFLLKKKSGTYAVLKLLRFFWQKPISSPVFINTRRLKEPPTNDFVKLKMLKTNRP